MLWRVWSLLATALVAGSRAAQALNATLVVSPATPAASPATVSLQWWGASDEPTLPEGSVIRFYTGAHESFGSVAVDGMAATDLLPQEIINVREPYRFELEVDGEVVAVSNSVAFANDDEPLQAHLAPTQNADELHLTFVTKNALAPPQARLGLAADALKLAFEGESVAPYTIADMCGAPANESALFMDPGHQNKVLLTGLAPNTTYFYQFGSDASGWSGVKTLKTPPAPGSPVRVAVYGDMGVYMPFDSAFGSSYEPAAASTALLRQRMQVEGELDVSLLHHIGDLSYARGYPMGWEWFHAAIEPLSSQAAYAVGCGNHEIDDPTMSFEPAWQPYGTDSGGECGVPYSQRYTMPTPTEPEYQPKPTDKPNRGNLWYAFTHGVLRFITMSSEHDFLQGSSQWNFVKHELASVDRSVTPWVVLMLHRPVYTSSQQSAAAVTNNEELIAALEPLMREFHVDVGLYGHVHTYERTCGILVNGTCADRDEDGTVHAVIGNAGNTYQDSWLAQDAHHFAVPEWVVFRTFEFGVSEIKADHAELEFTMRGVTRGEVHDRFTLRK